MCKRCLVTGVIGGLIGAIAGAVVGYFIPLSTTQASQAVQIAIAAGIAGFCAAAASTHVTLKHKRE